MANQDVGSGPGKDIIMRQLVNDAIKIEVEKTQRYQKPGRKAGVPEPQGERYGDTIEPKSVQQNGKFLAILNPGMPHLQSSQRCTAAIRALLMESTAREKATRQKSTTMTTGHRTYVAQRKAALPALPGVLLPALAWVLKVENTLAVCVLPQCGQGGSITTWGRKVRRSNVTPHWAQAYSKIGIYSTLLRGCIWVLPSHNPVSLPAGGIHCQ
jgi:hypothetical protein